MLLHLLQAPPKERAQGRPPPGCAPDAIKLFVGNIPKSYVETQLLPLFQSIGQGGPPHGSVAQNAL